MTSNSAASDRRRLIIGITGASGVAYGIRAMELLQDVPDIETHVVLSRAAIRTISEETDYTAEQIKALADRLYNFRDIGASISSGSYQTLGMLVAPCSIKTLSGIAHSYNDDLIVRAADVCLKERRPVVLLLRETPLHAGHIALMGEATRNGAIVMPPVPAFYHRPQTIDDIVVQTIGRALDLFGIDLSVVKRWTSPAASARQPASRAADDGGGEHGDGPTEA